MSGSIRGWNGAMQKTVKPEPLNYIIQILQQWRLVRDKDLAGNRDQHWGRRLAGVHQPPCVVFRSKTDVLNLCMFWSNKCTNHLWIIHTTHHETIIKHISPHTLENGQALLTLVINLHQSHTLTYGSCALWRWPSPQHGMKGTRAGRKEWHSLSLGPCLFS